MRAPSSPLALKASSCCLILSHSSSRPVPSRCLKGIRPHAHMVSGRCCGRPRARQCSSPCLRLRPHAHSSSLSVPAPPPSFLSPVVRRWIQDSYLSPAGPVLPFRPGSRSSAAARKHRVSAAAAASSAYGRPDSPIGAGPEGPQEPLPRPRPHCGEMRLRALARESAPDKATFARPCSPGTRI